MKTNGQISLSEWRKDCIVSHFLRKIDSLILITIPNDIKKVIFKLYAQHYDTWNKLYSSEKMKINDELNYIESNTPSWFCTAYGNHLICAGDYYIYRLKVIKNIKYLYIGIIGLNIYHWDDTRLLKHQNNWQWHREGYGCVLNGRYNIFSFDIDNETPKTYGKEFGNNNDIIDVVVDLQNNNSSITFVVNGKNCGVAYNKINKKAKYRLAVCIMEPEKGAKVQLL